MHGRSQIASMILSRGKQEEMRERKILFGRIVLPEGDGRPPSRYLPVTTSPFSDRGGQLELPPSGDVRTRRSRTRKECGHQARWLRIAKKKQPNSRTAAKAITAHCSHGTVSVVSSPPFRSSSTGGLGRRVFIGVLLTGVRSGKIDAELGGASKNRPFGPFPRPA
jgi:hypothetical protein